MFDEEKLTSNANDTLVTKWVFAKNKFISSLEEILNFFGTERFQEGMDYIKILLAKRKIEGFPMDGMDFFKQWIAEKYAKFYIPRMNFLIPIRGETADPLPGFEVATESVPTEPILPANVAEISYGREQKLNQYNTKIGAELKANKKERFNASKNVNKRTIIISNFVGDTTGTTTTTTPPTTTTIAIVRARTNIRKKRRRQNSKTIKVCSKAILPEFDILEESLVFEDSIWNHIPEKLNPGEPIRPRLAELNMEIHPESSPAPIDPAAINEALLSQSSVDTGTSSAAELENPAQSLKTTVDLSALTDSISASLSLNLSPSAANSDYFSASDSPSVPYHETDNNNRPGTRAQLVDTTTNLPNEHVIHNIKPIGIQAAYIDSQTHDFNTAETSVQSPARATVYLNTQLYASQAKNESFAVSRGKLVSEIKSVLFSDQKLVSAHLYTDAQPSMAMSKTTRQSSNGQSVPSISAIADMGCDHVPLRNEHANVLKDPRVQLERVVTQKQIIIFPIKHFEAAQPSENPSLQPSTQPVLQPSIQPTSQPSMQLSNQPTMQSSSQPSRQLSRQPSTQPALQQSIQHSCLSTMQPNNKPTVQPSTHRSAQPTTKSFQRVLLLTTQTLTPPTMPAQRVNLKPTQEGNENIHPTNVQRETVQFYKLPKPEPEPPPIYVHAFIKHHVKDFHQLASVYNPLGSLKTQNLRLQLPLFDRSISKLLPERVC